MPCSRTQNGAQRFMSLSLAQCPKRRHRVSKEKEDCHNNAENLHGTGFRRGPHDMECRQDNDLLHRVPGKGK